MSVYSPLGVHYPGLHPGPGREPAVAQGLLLEGGDGAPCLAQAHTGHTLLQPEHAQMITGQGSGENKTVRSGKLYSWYGYEILWEVPRDFGSFLCG